MNDARRPKSANVFTVRDRVTQGDRPRGAIPWLTGVSAPYQPPAAPALRVRTAARRTARPATPLAQARSEGLSARPCRPRAQASVFSSSSAGATRMPPGVWKCFTPTAEICQARASGKRAFR